MKVLMVNDSDPAETIGGTERYMVDVTEALECAGHEVHTFTLSTRGSHVRGHKRVFGFEDPEPRWRHLGHVFFHLSLYAALRACVVKLQPDVVHLHNNYRFAISVLLAIRGCRVVQTVHDYCGIYPTAYCHHPKSCATASLGTAIRHGCMNWKLLVTEGWLLYNRRFIDRHFVNAFLAPSRDLYLRLMNAGQRNVTHLPNLVHASALAAIGPRTEHKRVVLYVGILAKHKGVEILVKAAQQLQERFEDLALWIVGSGPEEANLKRLADMLELRNVTFWGHQDRAAVANCYERAEVVVIPSLWLENAPLVAYEAMAHGRALVVSDTGGLPELVAHGESGFVFRRGDVVDLGRKLGDAFAARSTADFGRAGRELLMGLGGTERHIERLTAIYTGCEDC